MGFLTSLTCGIVPCSHSLTQLETSWRGVWAWNEERGVGGSKWSPVLSHPLLLARQQAQPAPHSHTLGLAPDARHSQGQNVMRLCRGYCTREQPQHPALGEKLLALLPASPAGLSPAGKGSSGCTHFRVVVVASKVCTWKRTGLQSLEFQ